MAITSAIMVSSIRCRWTALNHLTGVVDRLDGHANELNGIFQPKLIYRRSVAGQILQPLQVSAQSI